MSFFVIPERLASIRAVALAFTENKQTNKQTNTLNYQGCRDGGGCLYTVIQKKTAASVVQGFKSGELNWRGASMDYTPDSANRSST